jgi:RHS repeat-associated protein
MRRVLVGLLVLAVCQTIQLHAQISQSGGGIQPLCVTGCGGGVDYEVQVTPDGQALTNPAFGTYTQTFDVLNSGNLEDSYNLTCGGTGLTCTNVTPSTLSLTHGQDATVTVTYTTGSAGVGSLYLTADSPTSDVGNGGYYDVTMTGAGAPVVSLSPYNPMVRSGTICAASCFDFVYSRGTPSYTSLNTARAFSLVYSSSMHRPTPVIQLDASYNAQTDQFPTSYKVEVRNGTTLLTLQNGATAAYFQALSGQPTRLSAAIDAKANGLSTGDYPVTVTVTALYPSTTLATTVSTRIVVLDETGSSFGAGIRAAGVQRIYFTGGSALVTEGDGSFVLYESTCGSNLCATYRWPGGANAALIWISASNVYRRVYMDSSYVEFNSTGRMTKAVDRFANTTQLAYADTLLTTIYDPMGKEIDLSYTNGKLASAKILGPGSYSWTRTTYFTMDGTGRLILVRDPDSYSDSLAYQSSGPGLLSIVWNRARARTDVSYDTMNRLASITAPAITTFDGSVGSPVTWFRSADAAAWQPALAGTSEANRKGGLKPDTVWATVSDSTADSVAMVRVAVDGHGAPLKVVAPYGATTTFTRDTASRATTVVQPNGHTVNYTFTGFLLTKMVDATLNRTENYSYTARKDLATITGSTVRRDFLYYAGGDGGPAGALRKVYVGNTGTYPTMTNATLVEWHKPDGLGRDTVVTDSLGHATRTTYDPIWGNTLTTKDPTGDLYRVHYDARGQVDSSWAPLSGKTVLTYGTFNEVLTQRTPFGFTTQFQYDPATLALVRLVDPKNQVYKWRYNVLGQLTAQYDVADTTKADTLKYDRRGQLRTRITRRGDAISLTYDLAGRLTSRSGPGIATDTYRYDPNGLWSVDSNAYAKDSTAVNAAGQTTGFVQQLHGATWTGTSLYDGFKRPTYLSVSNTALSYNAFRSFKYSASTGMLDTLCFNLNCSKITRNGDLLPTTVNYGNWSMTQTFSSTHQLSTQAYPAPLTGFGQTIGRDSLDRVTSLTPTGSTTVRKFTYDTLGRLVNACDKPGSGNCVNEFGLTTNAFSFDSAGNRIDGSAVVASGNRVTTFRGWTIGYDVMGQVTTKYPNPYNSSTARSYVWDALGRLTAVTIGPDTVARFRYDALGRRVLKVTGTTTRDSLWFVYNAGAQVLVDMSGNGTNAVRTEYGYAPGGDQVLTVKQLASGLDGVLLLDPTLGSVRGVAAWSGGTLKKDYRTTLALANPWGTTPVDTGTVLRFRWAGREYDQETGLYYLRARYYDPQLGRFLSEDPAGVAGGLDLYTYAGDDPVNHTDPLGLGPLDLCWINGPDGPVRGVEGPDGTCHPAQLPEITVQGNHGPPETMWGPGVPPMPIPPTFSGDPTAAKGQDRHLDQPGQPNSCIAKGMAAAQSIDVQAYQELGFEVGLATGSAAGTAYGATAGAALGFVTGVPGMVTAIPLAVAGGLGGGLEGGFYGSLAGMTLGPPIAVAVGRMTAFILVANHCGNH